MDWTNKLQTIIDYVEECLQCSEEPIDPVKIARYADCSYAFFQKVFSYMHNMSFSDYVRFRKMTLAGYELKSSDIKVIDLSYKYGYDSPTSFTKAFTQFHGVSPSIARKDKVTLNTYPKMKLEVALQFPWQIIHKKDLRLIGKSIRLSYQDNQHVQDIPAFWHECQKNGVFSNLITLDSAPVPGLFGLFTKRDTKAKTLEYAIMVQSTALLPQGYMEIKIPATTWVVFDCHGPIPQAIQNGWKFLQEEWLIQYPFKHGPYPEIEWYSDANAFSKDYLSQIWIPIIED